MKIDGMKEIEVELAIQLLGEERTYVRGYVLTSAVDSFEQGATVVRELVRSVTIEYAMENAKAVGRMRATVTQANCQYRVEGIYDPKVHGLRMDVSFRKKADFKSNKKKILLAVWNEETSGEATIQRISPVLGDSSTLH